MEKHPQVAKVSYPGLINSTDYALKQKYLPNGLCGVISFEIKGGKEAAEKWLNALQLVSREVHVADIRTCALHPATSTHRQLSEAELEKAGISAGLIRLSCGIESVQDILADLEQAFNAAK